MHASTPNRLFRHFGVFAAFSLLASAASGHERDFTLSRDWRQPLKGELELELWNAWETRENEFEGILKLDHGISEHIAIEPEFEYVKADGDNLELEEAALEAYFNFGDFAFNRVLPSFNLEYAHHVDADQGEADDSLQFRGALSLYTERGEDFTLNAICEHGFGDEVDDRWSSELTFGYLRPVDFISGLEFQEGRPLRIGFEFLQELDGDEHGRIGPVAAWRLTDSLHALVTATFGFDDRAENPAIYQLVLEWEF